MPWYVAYYGSWNDVGGVKFVAHSYSRSWAFAMAQQTANETGKVVTICESIGTGAGLRDTFYKVEPEQK